MALLHTFSIKFIDKRYMQMKLIVEKKVYFLHTSKCNFYDIRCSCLRITNAHIMYIQKVKQ